MVRRLRPSSTSKLTRLSVTKRPRVGVAADPVLDAEDDVVGDVVDGEEDVVVVEGVVEDESRLGDLLRGHRAVAGQQAAQDADRRTERRPDDLPRRGEDVDDRVADGFGGADERLPGDLAERPDVVGDLAERLANGVEGLEQVVERVTGVGDGGGDELGDGLAQVEQRLHRLGEHLERAVEGPRHDVDDRGARVEHALDDVAQRREGVVGDIGQDVLDAVADPLGGLGEQLEGLVAGGLGPLDDRGDGLARALDGGEDGVEHRRSRAGAQSRISVTLCLTNLMASTAWRHSSLARASPRSISHSKTSPTGPRAWSTPVTSLRSTK